MEWIDAVKEIKKAQENNRLVIFVGAGVSKNSGIPTWKELINDIAGEIHYSHCDVCDKRKDECPLRVCEERTHYTQDEFLRIPEYFYQQSSSVDKREYYGFLQQELYCDNGPNLIDDEVFNVLPHHIITTNFDSLLENSLSTNSKLYQVVIEDKDLINKASDRYLIKMHGDLNIPSTMVLKESDYIEYEQTHPLISNFIRSLLINHTFLFLGYSLNDSNLNLIIGWINYFRHNYKVDESPKNFLITTNESSDFEKVRLKDKNIYPISLSAFPNMLQENTSDTNSYMNEDGKKLLTFLRCMTDIKIFQKYAPTERVLDNYQYILESYKQISVEDFLNVYQIKATVSGTVLYFQDNEQYQQIIPLLGNNCKTEGIKNDFSRTIITEIRCRDNQYLLNEKTYNNYFQIYLNNDYVSLESHLQLCADTAIKIYYYKFLHKKQIEIDQLVEEDAQETSEDWIDILIHKMRARLSTITLVNRQVDKSRELRQLLDTVPNQYKPAVGYIEMLFADDSKNISEMQKILERQKKKYSPESNTIYSEDCYKCILDIQSYAYDYYFFFKCNSLPLDNFQDPKKYLQYYIESIICSYYPQPITMGNDKFFMQEELKPYPLNEIDFDIFIKYIKSKDLRELIDQYKVKLIQTTQDYDISAKYINLCNSFYAHPVLDWIDQINNFNILICLLDLDNNCQKNMFSNFIDIIKRLAECNPGVIYQMFDSIYSIVKELTITGADSTYRELLHILISPSVFPDLIKYWPDKYADIIKELKDYKTNEIQRQVIVLVYSQETIKGKIDVIFELRQLLPMQYYVKFLEGHLGELNTSKTFDLLVEGIFDYSEKIERLFIDSINYEDMRHVQNPNVRTFPDWFVEDINMFIILRLYGYNCDLHKLEIYTEKNSYLRFLLNPENFDYSLVETYDYMWQNIILSKEYRPYFLKHKYEMYYGKLGLSFDELTGTVGENREDLIYYIFLNDQ